MLTASDIRGAYAIMPTPARPDASRVEAVDTVDLDESAHIVDNMIADGVDGLIALGTTGEAATLTPSEYRDFVDCVLQTVRGRVPTFIGTTTLGTHETYQRMKFAQEQGADGTLLGLPIWQPLSAEAASRFYASLSEALPDFAIMAYANQGAFRNDFGVELWQRVAGEAPTVTSAKVLNRNTLIDSIRVSDGRINFMPNCVNTLAFYNLSPETTTACWSTASSMGPAPVVALMSAILSGNVKRAEEISKDMQYATETMQNVVRNGELFAQVNIQMEKIRFDAAGYCKPGPIRPPYNWMPPELVEAAKECGRRWAELCRTKFTNPGNLRAAVG